MMWTLMWSLYIPRMLVTVTELATEVNRLIGNEAGVVTRPLPEDDPTRRQPDITQAREQLGWSPKVPFEEGLRRTIAWFEETA